MRDDALRTRILLGLGAAAAWGTAAAGIWLLPRAAVTVITGLAVTGTFALRACWIERRAQERARVAITEAHKREQALIKTIERLTGAKTGPIPVLRDVA